MPELRADLRGVGAKRTLHVELDGTETENICQMKLRAPPQGEVLICSSSLLASSQLEVTKTIGLLTVHKHWDGYPKPLNTEEVKYFEALLVAECKERGGNCITDLAVRYHSGSDHVTCVRCLAYYVQ